MTLKELQQLANIDVSILREEPSEVFLAKIQIAKEAIKIIEEIKANGGI